MSKYVIAIALMAAGIVAVYLAGDRHGANRIHAEWKAAEDRALEQGIDARRKAEATIAKAPAPSGKPCAVRDLYDRDCRK